MAFEWDPQKNRANIAKHGVGFLDARRIFDGPLLEREDDRFDYGETRIIAYGEVSGVVLAVVYVWRGKNRRLISARRATKDESGAWRRVIYGRARGTDEKF